MYMKQINPAEILKQFNLQNFTFFSMDQIMYMFISVCCFLWLIFSFYLQFNKQYFHCFLRRLYYLYLYIIHVLF